MRSSATWDVRVPSKRSATARRADIDIVTRDGIRLRTNECFHLHYDKVVIVDGHTLLAGTHSTTHPPGETLNSEKVVVMRGMPEPGSH